MLHSISSSHFPTHRNCKRNACRLSLIACNLSHKNCTHKCVCQCVCVCCLKSFIAELCIFLLHSSCINSGIIALYDQQLPPAAASPSLLCSSAWLLIGKSSLQVPGDCSKATHETHTDRQADRQTEGRTGRPTVYMHMWLISRRLRFLHALAVTVPDGEGAAWLGRAGAALKCRTCLVSKISVIHSVLPGSPTWSARLLLLL